MLSSSQIKRRVKILLAGMRRIGLKNRGFSIISNNCWGGAIYDQYHLPYLTPTIGLWFPAEDYIKFLKDMPHYLESEMTRISYEECHAADLILKRKETGKYSFNLKDMIIGRIDDVDIVFLHYKDFEDAKSKWERRKRRINYDNLLVKDNDQNGFSEDLFEEFKKLEFPNKLFFTANKKYQDENCYYFTNSDADGSVADDTNMHKQPIIIKKYINELRRTSD